MCFVQNSALLIAVSEPEMLVEYSTNEMDCQLGFIQREEPTAKDAVEERKTKNTGMRQRRREQISGCDNKLVPVWNHIKLTTRPLESGL